MKGSCEIDMNIASTDVASRHVTTDPQVSTPWRAKTASVNGALVAVLVALVVMVYVLVLVERIEQNGRIAVLEAQIQKQWDLIRELQGSLRRYGDIRYQDDDGADYDGAGFDTTDDLEGRKEDRILPEQAELNDDVINNDQGYKQSKFAKPGKAENPDVSWTDLLRNGNTERVDHGARRIKRTVSTTTAAPTQRIKSGRSKKKGHRRERNESRESLSCDHVNQCNGTVGGRGRGTLVAHFEVYNDSDNVVGNVVSDEIIGGWNHASWMSHHEAGHEGFRIRGRGRPSRAKIEVKESGIYYVYSQVTFSDNGSYLAYSIMIDDEPKFNCRFFLTQSVVDSNTCVTQGLVKIEAGQVVHIQLAERNKVISMDKESTFFGLMRMLPLDD